MRIVILSILITLLFYSCKSQRFPSPIHKTYIALSSQSCSLGAKGVCTISSFHKLSFEDDYVTVCFYVEADCSSKELEDQYPGIIYENIYKWQLTDKGYIHILSCDQFEDLKMDDNLLIGKIELHQWRTEDLKFVEQL